MGSMSSNVPASTENHHYAMVQGCVGGHRRAQMPLNTPLANKEWMDRGKRNKNKIVIAM